MVILKLVMAVALAGVLGVPPVDAQSRLYKWVDDDGNVHYSDSVPPEEARQRREREVKSESGTTRDVIQPPPTREELSAREQARLEAERAERLRREQAQADRNLLLTFDSVEHMERARDGRLTALDGQVGLLRQRLRTQEERLERARREAARQERVEGGDPEPYYRRIEQLEQRRAQSERAISDKHAEKDAIRAEFARDIKRFRNLTEE